MAMRMIVIPKPSDPGSHHLVWVGRFMLVLWPLGTLAWLARSRWAALAFAAGGLVSLGFWFLHRWVVGQMGGYPQGAARDQKIN